MTPQERKALKDFETRVRKLMLDFRQLRAERSSLQRQVETLEAQLETEKAKGRELGRELSSLRMAHIVRFEEGDIKEARSKLNKMVREVDKCIALLAT